MGKQTEFSRLAEVTFMSWVFMAIITNNRRRLDVAESLSASWGAGADSARVIFKARIEGGACAHTSLRVPRRAVVLGPCIRWLSQTFAGLPGSSPFGNSPMSQVSTQHPSTCLCLHTQPGLGQDPVYPFPAL